MKLVIEILCFHLFLSYITARQDNFYVSSILEAHEEQTQNCKTSEFQCKNNQCIAKAFVCDGLPDCSDDSDETYNQCQNITCDERYFQCHYGACINKKYHCDGTKQCVDGSDELTKKCDEISPEPVRIKRHTYKSRSCIIPPPSVNNTLTYLCAENTSKICNPENGLVPESTIAVIKCSPGYGEEEKDYEKENNGYLCYNKKWVPEIDRCYKICDKLSPVNVDFQCFRNGMKIRCDENTVLLHGTTVRPSCKPLHKYSNDSPSNYSEMTCKSDGKWDKALFPCIPECGRMYTYPKLLIKRSTPERFSDSPWHVAIYNKKKVLICGGTIITPDMVVSAAHCFHEERSFPRGGNATDYEVVVGKVTKNYDVIDNHVQKPYKIKNILSKEGYLGAVNFHEADIAILILEEKIKISPEVLPACLDWVALRDGIYPAEDTLGKVAGWGINEHGNYSNTVATVDSSFLGHKRCLEIVPKDFKQFITFDKFCAGSENDTGALRGDSGSGLLFKKNNHYYLHGIVSIKQLPSTGIAAFTDIADHVRWISKIRKEVEGLNENTTELQTITTTPHTTKSATRDDRVESTQDSGTNHLPTTSASPSSTAKMPPKNSVPTVPETSHPSSVFSNQEIPKEQTNNCESSEFQCKNDRCIAKSFVCDGLRDCLDGSDETYDQCQNITCDKEYFQCHYGACINKTYQCDGIKQCIDGSDESAELCGETSQQSLRKSRATGNSKSCTIPAPSVEKTTTFFCPSDTSSICNPENGLVAEHTTALIKCSPGYGKERKDDEEENNEYHVCLNKKWLPKIERCYKICDKLNPVNVDLRCFRNGLNIQCDENTILLHGTRVRPSCKSSHKYSSGSPPDYSEITCNSEGKWDNTLFSCTPECGIPYTNPKVLIKGGTTEKFGDSPWHVAIYNKKKILICGGTIITPNLVVSAAHCFEGENFSTSSNANNYEVVVGKVTRNYDAKDSVFQKTHKIKKIRYSSKGYFGIINGYQADIAILVLEEKLNISSAVLPACLDWVDLRDGIYPAENTLGKVVGWGNTENGKESDILVTADLPFLSHERCLQTVPDDFKQFITFDKFCAGSENGSGVLQGDSGGGLLFKKNDRYFLQGIVSIKQPTSTGIAAFTDIAEHEGWITKVRKEVEEEFNKSPTEYQTRTSTATTTKATTPDYGVKFSQNSKITRPASTPTSPNSTATRPSSKNAVSIALENCEKYASYRNVRKLYPSMANQAEFFQNSADCVNVVSLIYGGTEAKPKEYPHMAIFGYEYGFGGTLEFICSGSLISEKFILSTASCSLGADKSPVKRVLLGDLDLESEKDDAKPAIYEIKKIYKHPGYNQPSFLHNIALYELNTTVDMSPYVRPACLHTSTSIPIDTKASIVGWGYDDLDGTSSDRLLKATISVLNPKNCRGADPVTNICAGDLINRRDTCTGDLGVPLQIPINKQSCMWDIVGIASQTNFHCGMRINAGIYTKVEYYLSWIQEIVWPQ